MSPVVSCCPGYDPGDEVGNEILDSWSRGVHKWYGKYQIVSQRTASVWMPFEQACDEESGDADFDSSKTAPWDDGETQRDDRH